MKGRLTSSRIGVAVVSLIGVLAFVGSAAADRPAPDAPPRATTVTLDSFVLSPVVQYASNNFWCEAENYGAYFSNYTGACAYQDYVATIHWKKAPTATAYYACVTTSFHDYNVGFACYGMVAPKAANPDSLSYTFDSAAMHLNATQGITVSWMVTACAGDWPLTYCSESDMVSETMPWTG